MLTGREWRASRNRREPRAPANGGAVNPWTMVVVASLVMAAGGAAEPMPTWKADHLMVQIQILPHDRIRVDEQIALDLGFERHRQLERRIHLVPLAPGRPRLDVRLIAVTDAQGAAWPIRTWQWGDDLEIRIGNGESFLTGRQSVHLVYEVDGAVLAGRKRDTLLWDIGGGPWEVPIVDTRITVALPPGAEPEVIDSGSEVGRPGELVRHADFKTVDRSQVRFSLMTGLAPRETCRIFVGWPTGLTAAASPAHRFARALVLRPWWGTAIVALGWVALSAWARSRARTRGRASNAPQPKLTPAELAWLGRPELTAESLLATTLDLARRGELAIVPAADSFRLERSLAESDPSDSGDRERPFEAEWSARIFAAGDDRSSPERECGASELGWRARLARPAVESALASGLVASGHLYDRRRSRIGQRLVIRLAIALALSAFLALLAGARFPAAWPGIALASGTAAFLPLAIECRRRTATGESAAAWAGAFADRTRTRGELSCAADEALLPCAAALAVGPELLFAQRARPSYWPPLLAGAPPTPSNLWREWEALAQPFRSATATVSGRA